ncbi:MAG: hypothetical protein HYZ90_03205 [Candidatus Omnitrophica bacterium]|nr:hypothetical protein [Candidatus Omnitrophota bacterium]
MSWLSRLLGYVPQEERAGISLDHSSGCWEISGFQDLPSLLRGIRTLFPNEAVLYLEGTSIAADVEEFIKRRQVGNPSKVEMSVIWPRPSVFHMSMSHDNVSELIALAEKRAIPEICDHLHVYQDGVVLLEGPDILDCCVSLSLKFSEEQIKAFCAELHCRYERIRPQ